NLALTVGAAGATATLHLWDVPAGRELRRLPLPARYDNVTLAFSTDSTRFAVRIPNGDEATIRVYDVRSGSETVTIHDPQTRGPGTLFFLSDGKTLVVAGRRVVGYSLSGGAERFSYRIET